MSANEECQQKSTATGCRLNHKKIKDKSALVDDVRRVIRASIGNRAKESLVVDFINQTDLDQIDEHISRKIESAEWGDGVVDELARYLAETLPGPRGFTRRNLFRMRQFYEACAGDEEVSPLVTPLPWTHHGNGTTEKAGDTSA